MTKPFNDNARSNADVQRGHQLYECLLLDDRPRYSVDPARLKFFIDTIEQGGPRAVRALIAHRSVYNADMPYVFRAAALAILSARRPDLLDVLVEGYEKREYLYDQDMGEVAIDLVKRVDARDEGAVEIQRWLKTSRYKDRIIDRMLAVTVNRDAGTLSRLDDFLKTVGDMTAEKYLAVLQERLASEPPFDNYTGGRSDIIPMIEYKIRQLEQYLVNPPAAQPWAAELKAPPPVDASVVEAPRVIHAPRVVFKRKR